VILDSLADLKSLAERASDTSEMLTEDAAFAEVERQVATSLSLWVDLGVASSWPSLRLTPAECRPVCDSAAQMKQVLEGIAEATDDELVAYASTTAERRGSLLAVSRQARALRAELLSAQQVLLRRLAEQVWPDGDPLRLDLMAHLSDNPTAAETARRVIDILQDLTGRIARAEEGVQASAIDALIDAATGAAFDAEALRAEPIDDEVLRFWRAASAEKGALLTTLTPVVRDWLDRHGALGSFRVYRTQ